tara:strand:- start:155 stop:484 length:330 start_codon:yes stop_codon:yes gene_type:complete
MNKIKFYWDVISPILTMVLTGVTVFFVVGLVLSIPLCLLWNWLMPYIFGLPKLTLLQTFGLSILISLLSPRKVGLGSKEKNSPDYSKELDEANKNLEHLLKDLSSQFRA